MVVGLVAPFIGGGDGKVDAGEAAEDDDSF